MEVLRDLKQPLMSWVSMCQLCNLAHACVCMLATLWNGAHQAPLSMGFSRQDYWSELPFPPPGDLSNPGTEHRSPASQADSLPSEPLAFQVDQW